MRRGRLTVTGAALAFAGVIGGAALAAPGNLDRGFGGDGKVTTDFGVISQANAVTTLEDGSIMAAGRAGADAAANFALAKYRPDGAPDTSFGGGDGRITQNLFGSVRDAATDVLEDPDGNLVVAGVTGATNSDLALARFLPGGGLDTSFNPAGTVPGTTSVSFTSPDSSAEQATAVARAGDGDLVVAAVTTPSGGDEDSALARHDDDGTLHDAFGPGGLTGRAVYDMSEGGRTDLLVDVAVLPGGDLLAAGWRLVTDTKGEAFVARFDSDGELHPTYGGGDGIASLLLPGEQSAIASSLVVEPNGSAVIGGYAQTGLDRKLLVGKFRPNGTLDPSFAGDGSTITDFPPSPLGDSLVGEPGGRVTLVGVTVGGTEGQAWIAARYLPNGRLDRSFSGDGIAKDQFAPTFPPNEGANAATLVPSGAIVAAGYRESDFALLAWQGMPDCFGRQPTLAAYPGATAGTGNADVISGDTGKLKVRAGGGNDRVCGGPRKDKLKGQAGKDKLKGGKGNDRLSGSAGKDVLHGGPGKRDVCRSGPGSDTLRGCERGS